MQETTITRRFTLERHSTLGQATAATMKAVEAALAAFCVFGKHPEKAMQNVREAAENKLVTFEFSD